jgi:Cu-Zn family superoxide dismutase
MFRPVAPVAVILAAVLMAGPAGCGSAEDTGGVGGGTGAGETTTNGTFAPYRDGAVAVSYDPALVPEGATAAVTVTETDAGTTVTLEVAGLRPARAYGAHLHTKPCGAAPTDAGPHLQHEPDPAASVSPPSVDPSYANPANEVWLDFTTDGSGAARSAATLGWRFDPAPRSLVIHADTTKTAPGVAGTAGARAACLSLPE